MASRWVGRAWVRLLAARGVRPVCVPANAWVGILSVGPPTGFGATPPCSPTRTLSLSWAGRVFSLCEFVGREERGACELGALSCREAWSRGPGGGSKRSRTVARSQWVVLAEAGLGQWPDVGRDEGQVVFLEVFTDVGDKSVRLLFVTCRGAGRSRCAI